MAFQPVPYTASARVQALAFGEQVENVLHFQLPTADPWTLTDLEDLAAAVTAAWVNNFLGLQGGNYVLQQVVCTNLAAESGPQYVGELDPPVAGSATGEMLPNSNALCYTLYTALIGRSFRGRMYLCGITESQVNGNNLTAGAQAAFTTAGQDFRSDMLAASFVPGVVSRWNAGVLRPDGIFTPITSWALRDGQIDSQRRRMP